MRTLVFALILLVPQGSDMTRLREHGVKIHILLDGQEASGSGVYIDKFTILTANHLYMEGATYFSDDQHLIPLIIGRRDETKDLMLVSTLVKGKVASLGSNPKRLDTIYAVGYPMGSTNVIVQGRIADFTDDQLLVDATVVKGMSGGGVYSENGRLVGITSASWGDDKFMVAISLKAIKKFLEGK